MCHSASTCDARRAADASSAAGVRQFFRKLPAQQRPRIILYGQSLGAIGAETARVWADDHRPGTVRATVLSGVPADTVATHTHGSPRIVMANATDPVTTWSAAEIWRTPSRPSETVTVGKPTRRVPWLPGSALVIADLEELRATFINGRCDAFTTDASSLAAFRYAQGPNADKYFLIPGVI